MTTSGIRGVYEPLTRDRGALVRAVDRVTLQDRSSRMRFGSPYISEHQAEQIDRFGELASAGNVAFDWRSASSSPSSGSAPMSRR